MKSLNYCSFIGNLGQDPDLRFTSNQKEVCNFSIAVSDDYIKDGAKVDATEWVKVVTFGKLAEICNQYLKKGSKVFISGRMKTRSWDQDGVKKYITEIVASEMQMLDSPNNSESGAAPRGGSPKQGGRGHPPEASAPATPPQPNFDNFDDDIPF